MQCLRKIPIQVKCCLKARIMFLGAAHSESCSTEMPTLLPCWLTLCQSSSVSQPLSLHVYTHTHTAVPLSRISLSLNTAAHPPQHQTSQNHPPPMPTLSQAHPSHIVPVLSHPIPIFNPSSPPFVTIPSSLLTLVFCTV